MNKIIKFLAQDLMKAFLTLGIANDEITVENVEISVSDSGTLKYTRSIDQTRTFSLLHWMHTAFSLVKVVAT